MPPRANPETHPQRPPTLMIGTREHVFLLRWMRFGGSGGMENGNNIGDSAHSNVPHSSAATSRHIITQVEFFFSKMNFSIFTSAV